MLSREDAVRAGVSELHDAVEDYKRVYLSGQASAAPSIEGMKEKTHE
jgi:hypothetical protein